MSFIFHDDEEDYDEKIDEKEKQKNLILKKVSSLLIRRWRQWLLFVYYYYYQTYHSSSSSSFQVAQYMPCCKRNICLSCLYRHITCILQEGISGQDAGRTLLDCPLGCRRRHSHQKHQKKGPIPMESILSEKQIRSCFHKYHFTLQHSIIGYYILYPLWYTWFIITCYFTSLCFMGIRIFISIHIMAVPLAFIFPLAYSSWKIYFILIPLIFCFILVPLLILFPISYSWKQQQTATITTTTTRETFFNLLSTRVYARDMDTYSSLHSNTSLRYQKWFFWTKSLEERQVIQLYERWSLTMGLLEIQQKQQGIQTNRYKEELPTIQDIHNHTDGKNEMPQIEDYEDDHYTFVLRCPRPNCTCLWLSNRTFRNQKLEQEERSWIFYKPLSSYKEYSIHGGMNGKEAERIDSWIHPSHFQFPSSTPTTTTTTSIPRTHDTDSRTVTCPQCYLTFCALCYQSWTMYSSSSSTSTTLLFRQQPSIRQVSHQNQQCSIYKKKISSSQDIHDFMHVAESMDARFCPGCSMRTCRSEGCNHMKCPSCGKEWCYACGCNWNVSHYECKNHRSNRVSHDSWMCIVS